jgi:hypothetical protein
MDRSTIGWMPRACAVVDRSIYPVYWTASPGAVSQDT